MRLPIRAIGLGLLTLGAGILLSCFLPSFILVILLSAIIALIGFFICSQCCW